MERSNIIIESKEEAVLKKQLEVRADADAQRIKRFLATPDLSRTGGSPLSAIIDKIKQTSTFKNFDDIKIPEIIPTHILFDLFNMPPGHPARSKSDTYYVDEENVLRTHDTVMWYYYFNHPEIKERISKAGDLAVVCYGKVYRKDEIDRHHMNVFHQFGGLYLTSDKNRQVTLDDLKSVLAEVAKSIFGPDVEYNFTPETFPYTDPSVEMNIKIKGEWVEMVGSGLPRKDVLANFGVKGYNGWAFGFGLERLAIVSMDLPDIRLLWSQDSRVLKQLKLGNKFVEVSKYPPITRDISFVVNNDFVPNNYFDLIRDIGGDLVEQVELLDKYENEEKFGKDKVSFTYRVVYRSTDRTLKTEEVEPLQNKLYEETKTQYNADLR
jgi:phenylalanyl-tRNA synthetase alpha chain